MNLSHRTVRNSQSYDLLTRTIRPADAQRCKSHTGAALRLCVLVVLSLVMALSWTSVVYAEGQSTDTPDAVQTSCQEGTAVADAG
ncbi:MAG: hypothetical protein FJ010_14870, partial [Chloroflexi bacterium]|nr:hypothetical protein [Chloroflexota bacterium]